VFGDQRDVFHTIALGLFVALCYDDAYKTYTCQKDSLEENSGEENSGEENSGEENSGEKGEHSC
jgi:hypothetical protein